MYNYIPHPSNCRVSSTVLRLLAKEGAAGYGIYWMVLEMLRDSPGYEMQYDADLLAYTLHVNDVQLIKNVCELYNVFTITKDGRLTSPWLLEAMGEYDERKKKLQEAGRRGAAHRWKTSDPGSSEAIASPSLEDGEAIAFNQTKLNVIQQNLISPSGDIGKDWKKVLEVDSPAVGADYLEEACAKRIDGRAPAYVAQVCMQYSMSEAVCEFIVEATNGADLTNGIYQRFCTLVRRIQKENWVPKHPANFFLSKIFE